MSRAALMLLLVVAVAGPIAAGRSAVGAGAQEATPVAGHPLVGSWVVEEILRPQNAGLGTPLPEPRPQAVVIATLFADGNALLSGFGAGQPAMQGKWIADGERAGTFTVVGLLIGGGGASDGTLGRVRATVEVDATGDAFAGGYTFDIVAPDGGVVFTHYGWWSGTRVEVEPPDPAALTLGPGTPAAGTPAP